MEFRSAQSARLIVAVLTCSLCPIRVNAQQVPVASEIPSSFNLDMKTAVRLRPQLLAASSTPSGRYATGRAVFEKLTTQAHPAKGVKVMWELRIADDDLLNAYSSPEGTIYVGRALARLAGSSAGLWAAILSHEIAHVERRDWARRYLHEQALRRDGGAALVLGDPGVPTGTWMDSHKTSEEQAQYCRRLELDADLEGLLLMARAGYHPDYVPALHHLLHAASGPDGAESTNAMHPCWETRDRELQHAYLAALIEYDHSWPDWYASPGGNPPIVVFEDAPTVKKTSSTEWEIHVPLHCRNLAGAVEVVLRPGAGQDRGSSNHAPLLEPASAAGGEIRQLTGCTSPRTMITFTVTDAPASKKKLSQFWTDVYVFDDRGSVLARAEVPGVR